MSIAASPNVKDVSTPSEYYKIASREWLLPRTLMAGTEAMKKAAEKYLPKEAKESQRAYDARLARSSLFNGFAKTVLDMTDKVFEKPVVLADDVPDEIRGKETTVDGRSTRSGGWSENVDMSGRNLNEFAKDAFLDALQTGVGYILAEMPPPVIRPDGQTPTIADDIDSGRRPYLCYISAENLIGFKSKTVGGRQVVTQVRIRECEWEPDPESEFHEIEIEQIRVIEPGAWRIFRERTDDNGRKVWYEHSSGTTSLNFVPIAPFYTKRTGFMMGSPPLADLAEINKAHWQSSSDQRNILHVARVPILFARGINADKDSIEVGASSMIHSSSDKADMKFVEHTGAAINAGRDDIKDLEFQMQTLGLQLLMPRKNNVSATGEARDESKSNTQLGSMAGSLQDALELALSYMMMYWNPASDEDSGGSVVVNRDYGINMRDANDVQVLLAACNTGRLSRAQFWAELKRRGILMDSFDPIREADLLEEEMAEFGEAPGMPDDPDPAGEAAPPRRTVGTVEGGAVM